MSMCELIMRLSKNQLEKIIADEGYFWTLRNEWRETDHCIDIDKAWHGIHFLFTNSDLDGSTAARWIIHGDTPILNFDAGYGPANYLIPSQVREVSNLLENTTIEDLKKRYNPDSFFNAGIYPAIWSGEDALDYLLFYYSHLKNLYRKAAEEREYVLMIIG